MTGLDAHDLEKDKEEKTRPELAKWPEQGEGRKKSFFFFLLLMLLCLGRLTPVWLAGLQAEPGSHHIRQ
jgi:hypothetical protein